MHAKDWHLNTSKTTEVAILLNLIVTVRVKPISTGQGKVEVQIENKDIRKRINTVTKVANHFNPDSEAEIIAIKKLMGEAYLEITMIRE